MTDFQDRLPPGSTAVPATGDVATSSELLQAIEALRKSVDLSTRQASRLATAIEQALKRLESIPAQAGPAVIASPADTAAIEAAAAAAAARKTVNWVIGPADNINWAYGNNAKRLSGRLNAYQHLIGSTERSDIAVYFDVLVAERYPVPAPKSILRIGGPRPLDRLFGDNVDSMRQGLAKFDAIIALNGELYLRAMKVHRNVHLIPNALDLKEWRPSRLTDSENEGFTVGFAASVKSSAEAEVKGLDIARAAAQRVGARLLQTSKGENQIAHDRMIPDFYSKIDALLCPVAPGREGSSNVIMEALALGIPVITTVHAGYHSEFLVDGKNVMIRERSDLAFAEALATLQRDQALLKKIGAAGRAFAERHHDLATIAHAYGKVIGGARIMKPLRKQIGLKIAFVPFWEPIENFGSSRLRAHYPSQFLARAGQHQISIGYDPEADIVIVIQCCSDEILKQLQDRPGQFLIYDVCDKYYENPRLFKHLEPPVDSMKRFHELAERADLVLTPTLELKADISTRLPHKPVRYIPEPVDYGATPMPTAAASKKVALWFGNPDRGNFESARWLLDQLRDQHGYELLMVSRKSFFKKYPEYLDCCVDWSLEAMADAFAKAGICVVAHDEAEQAKSPNRFIAAMIHGVPTLIHHSPSCSAILKKTGHEFAVIEDERGLTKAVGKLASYDFRDLYVRRVQRHLDLEYGEKATVAAYARTFADYTFPRSVYSERTRRVGFVSHNLALGEGAPRSLMELVGGLRRDGISTHVFSAAHGPLLEQYESEGMKVEVFDMNAKHVVKVLNAQYPDLVRAFTAFLKNNEIEVVVCNTVKSAPFVALAHQLGIPAAVIVRESYGADERFTYFTGDAKREAMVGLTSAEHIVFVSHTSREGWSDHPFAGQIHVIPNAVSPARFAADLALTKAEARAQMGLPAEPLLALCVGTINGRKGQQEIMEAFAEMPAEIRARVNLVFLGAVPNSQLDQVLKAHEALPEDVRNQVLIVDATEEVGPYYRASDIVMMNSSSESYPRTILEGLFFGLPILSTPVYGVKEQVRHGETGLLYEFNDMAAWKAGLTKLVDDSEYREQMATAAGRSSWMLTGHNEMLQAYRTVIADLLRR